MTIAKDFASKFAVAFVAAAMIFSAIAPAVQAAEDTKDLQKTINDLLAQVAALQSKMGDDKTTTTTTTTTTSSCDVPMAPLTMGSKGGGVTGLQTRLIADGNVIAAGATGYFGAQTKMALAAWQTANKVMPAVGYYGPVTMAAMKATCKPVVVDEDKDPKDPTSSNDLSGEGALDKFEIDNASDSDVQEGAEDAEIAEITVEAADGDIEVDRMTFQIMDASITPTTDKNTEQDPWEVFETISLWVDGDMVAEFNASDEDNYLDEDKGEFRFSGLDLVLNEDEEVDMIVAATVMNSVDGAGVSKKADWKLGATGVRYFDADGVSEDDKTTGDLDSNPTVTANFDIVVEGDGEELKFALASSNPNASDIVVDLTKSTKNVSILEYTIEAKEADIELNDLYVDIDTFVFSNLVIEDVTIDIEGDEFNAENSASATTTKTKFRFDVDGDITVEEGEKVTVKVMVDLRSQKTGMTNRYANGTTIKATADIKNTNAEGADDIANSDLKGSAVGKVHTLVAEGVTLEAKSTDAKNTINNTTADASFGEFKINFDVTAVEATAFVALTAGRDTGNTGVVFQIEDANGAPVTLGAATQSLTRKSGGTVSGGFVEIAEGASATFELVVTYNPATSPTQPVGGGQFRAQLLSVGFAPTAVVALPADRSVAIPAEDFETSNTLITN